MSNNSHELATSAKRAYCLAPDIEQFNINLIPEILPEKLPSTAAHNRGFYLKL